MIYRSYLKHKDSGVPWLGMVPEGWEVKSICRLASCNDDSLPENVQPDQMLRYVDISSVNYTDGIVEVTEIRFADAPSRARRSAKTGDVVISTVRTYLKAVAVVTESYADCTYSTGFAVLRHRPSEVVPEFLKWLVLNDLVIQAIEAHSEGVSYPAINATELAKLKAVVPPSVEQTAIAVYLDRETDRIDTLIAAQRRLIDLLKEKRSALISHAVTKGLSPDAPMKDSGVPWLGRVPEGWGVAPLKRLAKTQLSNVNKLAVDGERPVKLCNYVDVYKNERITANMEFMLATASDEQIRRLSIRRGDVLITKDSETPDDIGVPSLVSEDCEGVVCGYHLALLRPHDGIGVGGYLARLLASASVRAQFSILAVGMTRYGLGKYDIENTMLPAPPAAEQAAIAVYLDRETARIDALVAKTTKAIELAQERRGALISAAVTGKIDVRDAVHGPAPHTHAPG